MPRLKAKNLARTTLAADLSSSATTCTVADASKLPDAPFRMVIGGDEIVEVTAKNGNTLTIIRAQEGTSAKAWPSGTLVENRFTAGYWMDLFKLIDLGAAGTLTISNDAITITQSFHFVDTENQASSDNLSTINGGEVGDLLFLRSYSSARTVILKHGVGNIRIPGGQDLALDSTDKAVLLLYDGSNWLLLGSAPPSFDSLTDTPPSKTGSAGLYVRVNSAATALEYAGAADMETVSRTIYVDSQYGSDTTGDGSNGNPFRTVAKAVSTIKNVIANRVTVTVYLIGRGPSYPYTLVSFGRFCIGTGRILFKGDLTTLLSFTATGGTATTIVKTGAGWETNAYAGKLVSITIGGTTYWRLIESNTSDTLTVIGRLPENPQSGNACTIYDWNTFLANSSANLSQGQIDFEALACTALSGITLFWFSGTASSTLKLMYCKAAGNNSAVMNIYGTGNLIHIETCLFDGAGYSYYAATSKGATSLNFRMFRSWVKGWAWHAVWMGGSGSYICVSNGTILENGSEVLRLDRNAYGHCWSPTVNGAVDKVTIRNGSVGLRVMGNSGCAFSGTSYVNYSGNETDRSADSATYSWFSDGG